MSNIWWFQDLEDQRIGSGGATLNALRAFAEQALTPADTDLHSWWSSQRVLIIHSGGDARRLPQYSLTGKLFSALPVKTPWGDVSTVFDELLVLSTAWVHHLSSGVVVASGDVLLTFDAEMLHWDRSGVSGVAINSSAEVGSQHGVYVVGEQGRVYAFLQKPTRSQVSEAGGLLPDGQVAVDSGLLRFDPATAAILTELAGVHHVGDEWQFDHGLLTRNEWGMLTIDLYEHMTLALTGQWTPAPELDARWHRLVESLRGVPFWCDLVSGEFTHIGTTTLFRRLMTEENNFSRLYEAQQRLEVINPPGMRSAGVIVDSVLTGGGELGAGSIAIECLLHVPIRAGRGAILHGLTDLHWPIEVPDDTVAHQVPIALPTSERNTVIRVYGVEDDPKRSVSSATATWFGRPMLEMLELLGIDPESVWPGIPFEQRTLWNARLFPLTTPEEAWVFARWMIGLYTGVSVSDWERLEHFSLATSTQWADSEALAEARTRRMQENWSVTALALAKAGSDLRPLLAHTPGLVTLATTGRALWSSAAIQRSSSPAEAASLYFQASRFFNQAGLANDATRAYQMAFTCIKNGVEANSPNSPFLHTARQWQAKEVTVEAPARIDFGGGWSDTPPFCLDWGGTVLNMAVSLQGRYPIATTIRQLEEPILRCISAGSDERVEYRETEEFFAPPRAGDSFTIPRAAMQLIGLLRPGETLERTLSGYGGGLEISTNVALPMGSGLGTSSVLAATVIRALSTMLSVPLNDHELSDHVMQLEQAMATGGGWQDQAGGIFPGTKIITSGPGLHQRLRVLPLAWTTEQQAEFSARFVLYYTGIRRIAKNLLTQVVGHYLARETATVQVLHSIKTLAMEMSYAMVDGDWQYLGELLDRHWQLNQQLDPHTTNAPINSLLQDIRPYLAGCKLAGAGGGGFLMMMAKSPKAAQTLRSFLATGSYPGVVYDYAIASDGLRVSINT